MTTSLRIVLVLGAFVVLALVLRKIRKSQLYTGDAIFWSFFSLILIVIAIFPQIVYACSELIGIASPSNLVFLVMIAVLIIKILNESVKTAKLQAKLDSLVQQYAIDEYEDKED